jgi:hypothetical protein
VRDYPKCGKCGCKALHEAGVGCHGVNAYTGIDCECRGWLSALPSNYDNRISGVTGKVPNPWKPSQAYLDARATWKSEPWNEQPTAPGTVASMFARMAQRYALPTSPSKPVGVAPTSSSISPSPSLAPLVSTESVSQSPPQACWCGAKSKFKNRWCGKCKVG